MTAKRMLAVGAVALLAVVLLAVGAQAASQDRVRDRAQDGSCAQCPNYADANGDGVCDNRGSGTCPNYSDADGDGVCDNKGECTGNRKRNGGGQGAGQGNGKGRCGGGRCGRS